MNAGVYFQRPMDTSFSEDLSYFIMIYLDDIIVYFKTHEEYQVHPRKLFERDKMLKWYSKREDQGKHGKFENLWKVTYIIHSVRGNNSFFLQELDGEELFGDPVKGKMLKHYFCQES